MGESTNVPRIRVTHLGDEQIHVLITALDEYVIDLLTAERLLTEARELPANDPHRVELADRIRHHWHSRATAQHLSRLLRRCSGVLVSETS